MTDISRLVPAGAPPRVHLPSLLRAEVSRLAHRRLVRVLAALLLLGIVVSLGVAFFRSAPATPDQLAQAQVRYDRWLAEYQSCAQSLAADQRLERCGPGPGDPGALTVDAFVDSREFRADSGLVTTVTSVGVAGAMLAFLVGSSAGGAEWPSRSMTLQLLWEPRRVRLLATKWVALVTVVAAISAVALALGIGLASLVTALRGSWAGTEPGFWPVQVGTAARLLVLAGITATLGLGLSTLTRNTGAALGVAFVWFAAVENVLRVLLHRSGPDRFLLSPNIGAWVVHRGVDVLGPLRPQPGGGVDYTTVHLSNLHGLSVLLAACIVIGGAALWSFTRRDVA